MFYLSVIVIFCIALAADWLAIAYHDARESLEVERTVNIASVMEVVSWLPLILAVDLDVIPIWVGAIVSVLGSRIGTRYALRKLKESRTKSP